MEQYIGTKIIEAEPAFRAADGQGNTVVTTDAAEVFPNYPSVEDGYRVRYADGYESWSPKAVFEEAYRPTSGMNFGLALEAMRKGHKVRRKLWVNGVCIGLELKVSAEQTEGRIYIEPTEHRVEKGAKNRLTWAGSQGDLLADDWEFA